MSVALREDLFKESLVATLTHPLTGVGMSQFANYEGKVKESGKQAAAWIGAHNSFTQVSADMGFPGLFLYLAGTFSPFFILQRMARKMRGRPEFSDMFIATFCMSEAFVGFMIAICFLNFGYFFYLPAFAGLVISFQRAAEAEMKLRVPATVSRNSNASLMGLRPPSPAVGPVAATIAPPSPSRPLAGSNRFRFNRYR